jgi:hypothetical protein
MAQRNYLVSTTALSLTASGTTVGSGNTQSESFVVARTLVRTGLSAGELESASATWSIHYVVSAMSTPYEMRLKLQRRNSGGTVQSESGYGTTRNATGTYDDDLTWAAGTWSANDQIALVWEHLRPSGTGQKNGTIDANGASYVDAPQAAQNLEASGTPTAQASSLSGTASIGRASTGSLSAQASTLSGTATVSRSASGSLEAQAATIVGDAELDVPADFEASGTLSAQASTLSGTATVSRAATGDLQAQASVIDGDAEKQGSSTDYEATGSLSAQSAGLSGTVTIARTATGTLTGGSAQISGSAESSAIVVEETRTRSGGAASPSRKRRTYILPPEEAPREQKKKPLSLAVKKIYVDARKDRVLKPVMADVDAMISRMGDLKPAVMPSVKPKVKEPKPPKPFDDEDEEWLMMH